MKIGLLFLIFVCNLGYSHNSLRICQLEKTQEKFPCVIGQSGVKIFKKEGDGGTPKGIFSISSTLFYRADRLETSELEILKAAENRGFDLQILTPEDLWVDDPNSEKYNQFVKKSDLAPELSHEKLYRKDALYDLILVINYNTKPIVFGKGSAIFIHIAREKNQNYTPTEGCIAFSKSALLKIIAQIDNTTKIKIPKNKLRKIIFL